MKRDVALFGGSFNPPHVAHVLATVYVLSVHCVDEVLVVPCFIHPFAKPLAPFEDRFEMCRRAFEWIPRATVSSVEQELGGASHTLRTVSHLMACNPEWSLRLVVGADIVLDAPRWKGFEEIRALAPPIVLGRQGVDVDGKHPEIFPKISSTQVRDALAAGEVERVRPMVPHEVLTYALDRKLYGLREAVVTG